VIDVKVTGADALARLSRDLKDAGEKDLRRELLRGIQRAAKPAREAAKTAARNELPRRGGLNDRVAASKFTARTRTGGKNPGVRITGKGELDLPALDRGRLRHPLFGNRRRWYEQRIDAGWFTKAMEDLAPQIRRELLKAIDDVRAKLRRRTP
jgi:hypothetical protein